MVGEPDAEPEPARETGGEGGALDFATAAGEGGAIVGELGAGIAVSGEDDRARAGDCAGGGVRKPEDILMTTEGEYREAGVLLSNGIVSVAEAERVLLCQQWK